MGLTTPEKQNPGTWPGLILQKGRGDQPKSHPVFACVMARGEKPFSVSTLCRQRRDDVGCVNMRGTLQACGVCVNSENYHSTSNPPRITTAACAERPLR